MNYRKQISPDALLSETDFRLYGICARMPHGLMRAVPLKPVSEGVHNVRWGIRDIRIIVLSRVPREDRNALWHLFGATEEGLRFGAARHQWRTPDVSTLLWELCRKYRTEDIFMAYTIEDYKNDLKKEVLGWLTTEERLRGLSPEEMLKRLSRRRLRHI